MTLQRYNRVLSTLVSPDGDGPDCYRHYEALGFGTVPITELDPFLYRHLSYAPVIYNNTDWNLTSLKAKLDPNPSVNRNLIWEEFWIDYVDSTVNLDLNLNWNDHDNDVIKLTTSEERAKKVLAYQNGAIFE